MDGLIQVPNRAPQHDRSGRQLVELTPLMSRINADATTNNAEIDVRAKYTQRAHFSLCELPHQRRATRISQVDADASRLK